MGDDAYKPPRRAKTATERDLEGLRAREDRERVRSHAPALGVPIHVPTPPPAEEQPEGVDQNLAEIELVLGRDVAGQFRELVDELTPPPIDVNNLEREPTPKESWQHATRVNQRVVNLLAQIAHQSGVGMQVGAELAKLRRGRRLTIGISIGSLVAAASALIAVGTKLYGKGYEAGEAASWKTYIGREVDRCTQRLDRLEGRYGSSRDRFDRPDWPLLAPQPAPKVTSP